MTKDEYQEALTRAERQTPSLDAFREMQAYDGNVVWRLPGGAVVNLLDDALEEIDRLNEELKRSERREVNTWLTSTES